MPVCFLFPGQGAAAPGMGRKLAETCPEARRVFDEADDALGVKLSDLCFAGDREALTLTENQQPAVLTVSLAALACYRARGEGGGQAPDYAAGHSLGEYAALVCAGAVSVVDAVRAVRLRGRFMQEAVSAGEGSMAAVLGMDVDRLESICEALRERGREVWTANHNGGGQTVISGRVGALDEAAAAIREAGGKRIVPLAVSAPFHTPLMQPAADRLAEVLAGISWRDPELPVVSNIDALPHEDAASIAGKLTRQVTSPVLWEQSVNTLVKRGVDRTLEMEPGSTLSGLVKRIAPSISRAHVADLV